MYKNTPQEFKLVNLLVACFEFLQKNPNDKFWQDLFLRAWKKYHQALKDGQIDVDLIGNAMDEADYAAEAEYIRNCGYPA